MRLELGKALGFLIRFWAKPKMNARHGE